MSFATEATRGRACLWRASRPVARGVLLALCTASASLPAAAAYAQVPPEAPRLTVIGFDVSGDSAVVAGLRAVAMAGGGVFVNADDADHMIALMHAATTGIAAGPGVRPHAANTGRWSVVAPIAAVGLSGAVILGLLGRRRRGKRRPLLILKITEPGAKPRAVAVFALPVSVGRGSEAEVRLDDPAVSRTPATLRQSGTSLLVHLPPPQPAHARPSHGSVTRSLGVGDSFDLGGTRIEVHRAPSGAGSGR